MKFLLAILLSFFSLTNLALADARLGVTFNPDPLFRAENFTPGDQVSGQVTVTNHTETSQSVIAAAANVDDQAGLGQIINFQIAASGGPIVFNDDLADFFNQGELILAPLGAGESQVFNFAARFKSTDDNTWQEQNLSFDLCVGFQGDQAGMNCGNSTTEAGAGETPPPGASQNNVVTTDATGGSSSGNRRLIISNERAAEINTSPAALITWQTNLPATSQVVYGLSSAGPYTLDLTLPNFGYPRATAENLLKVTNHTVTLSGLIPGADYSYRVVSRASPATVSVERHFVVPLGLPPTLALLESPVFPETVVVSPLLQASNSESALSGQTQAGSEVVTDQYPRLELPAPALNYDNLAAAGFALDNIPASAWWVLLFVLAFIALLLSVFKRSRRNVDNGV